MSCGSAVNRDALAAVCHYAPAEHGLLNDANRFMHAESELVEPEAVTGLKVHPAYFHIHAKRAGSQRFGHTLDNSSLCLSSKGFSLKISTFLRLVIEICLECINCKAMLSFTILHWTSEME